MIVWSKNKVSFSVLPYACYIILKCVPKKAYIQEIKNEKVKKKVKCVLNVTCTVVRSCIAARVQFLMALLYCAKVANGKLYSHWKQCFVFFHTVKVFNFFLLLLLGQTVRCHVPFFARLISFTRLCAVCFTVAAL